MGGTEEVRYAARSWRVATGTLACPVCDAPISPGGPLSPRAQLECPVCDHASVVRDFLSLAAPTRPARVAVRVVPRSMVLPPAR